MRVTIEINNEVWKKIGAHAVKVSGGNLDATDVLLALLEDTFGEDNVKLTG